MSDTILLNRLLSRQAHLYYVYKPGTFVTVTVFCPWLEKNYYFELLPFYFQSSFIIIYFIGMYINTSTKTVSRGSVQRQHCNFEKPFHLAHQDGKKDLSFRRNSDACISRFRIYILHRFIYLIYLFIDIKLNFDQY